MGKREEFWGARTPTKCYGWPWERSKNVAIIGADRELCRSKLIEEAEDGRRDEDGEEGAESGGA